LIEARPKTIMMRITIRRHECERGTVWRDELEGEGEKESLLRSKGD
jgi:hypothetical protein